MVLAHYRIIQLYSETAGTVTFQQSNMASEIVPYNSATTATLLART